MVIVNTGGVRRSLVSQRNKGQIHPRSKNSVLLINKGINFIALSTPSPNIYPRFVHRHSEKISRSSKWYYFVQKLASFLSVRGLDWQFKFKTVASVVASGQIIDAGSICTNNCYQTEEGLLLARVCPWHVTTVTCWITGHCASVTQSGSVMAVII